jgi:hypothetical protein
MFLYFYIFLLFFIWIRGNLTPRKAHFVGSGEGVKPRLYQALIKGARLDSNSRPAVQISNPLPSHYVPWKYIFLLLLINATRARIYKELIENWKKAERSDHIKHFLE